MHCSIIKLTCEGSVVSCPMISISDTISTIICFKSKPLILTRYFGWPIYKQQGQYWLLKYSSPSLTRVSTQKPALIFQLKTFQDLRARIAAGVRGNDCVFRSKGVQLRDDLLLELEALRDTLKCQHLDVIYVSG